MPLVSVVIPTHSRTTMLWASARSALDQTFRDLELIIVASAATPETLDTANSIANIDPRCRVIDLRKDNLAAARNAGIAEARGEWVAFLDDDDAWLPNKIERQLTVDADMINCDFIERGGQFDGMVRHIRPPNGLSISQGFVLANYGAASASGAMVKTKVLRSLGGFDEKLNGCEDWDMWRRLSWNHRIVFLDEALTIVYRHDGAMQSRRRPVFHLRHTLKTIWDTPPHLRHMLAPMIWERLSPHLKQMTQIGAILYEFANRLSGNRIRTAWRYVRSLRY